MYSLGTWFVSGICINTLQKGAKMVVVMMMMMMMMMIIIVIIIT
jgi:hypothetical protein